MRHREQGDNSCPFWMRNSIERIQIWIAINIFKRCISEWRANINQETGWIGAVTTRNRCSIWIRLQNRPFFRPFREIGRRIQRWRWRVQVSAKSQLWVMCCQMRASQESWFDMLRKTKLLKQVDKAPWTNPNWIWSWITSMAISHPARPSAAKYDYTARWASAGPTPREDRRKAKRANLREKWTKRYEYQIV